MSTVGVLRLISNRGTAQLLSCALECPVVCVATRNVSGPSFAAVTHKLLRQPQQHCLSELLMVAFSPSLYQGNVVVGVTSVSLFHTQDGNSLVPTVC